MIYQDGNMTLQTRLLDRVTGMAFGNDRHSTPNRYHYYWPNDEKLQALQLSYVSASWHYNGYFINPKRDNLLTYFAPRLSPHPQWTTERSTSPLMVCRLQQSIARRCRHQLIR